MLARVVMLAAIAACGRVSFDPPADASGLGPWGAPTMVTAANGGGNPTLTGEMLELWFDFNGDIWVTKRASLSDPWGTAAIDTQLSTGADESIPEITTDGLSIFFRSNRGQPTAGIWTANRPTRADPWSAPVAVMELNDPLGIGSPVVTEDRLFLVIPEDLAGDNQILTSVRPSPTATWATPVELTEMNSPAYDSDSFVTDDRLTLYLRSDRDGNPDLYVSTRASVADPFSTPAPITELNTPGSESDPWVSQDGRHLFFGSDRGGAQGIWEATR